MGAEPTGQPGPGVRRTGAEDYGRAGRVLGRAFSEDPLWSVLMPEPRRRCLMFTGTVRMVAAGGGVVETTAGFEGAALWMPPGRKIGIGAAARSGLAPARWMLRPPWRNLRRMMALHRQVEAQRRQLMLEPHWRLEILGVDPAHQGRGLGSSLVRRGIERADGDRTPVYVDTSAEPNVDFYRRFGFEVIAAMTVTDLDAPFWMMFRPARP